MNPITREEQYLQGAVNAANGQATGDLPEPITREEKYLKGLVDAIENGGGSSLPEVTDADEGKGLVVDVNGEWDVSGNKVASVVPSETNITEGVLCVPSIYNGSDIVPAPIEDIKGVGQEVYDFGESSSTVLQLVGAIKQYAALSVGTPVAKYYAVSGIQAMGLKTLIVQIKNGVLQQAKTPFVKLRDSNATEIYSVKSVVEDTNNSRTAIAWDMIDNDYSNNKWYRTEVTVAQDSSAAKVYLVCTCFEATSLM